MTTITINHETATTEQVALIKKSVGRYLEELAIQIREKQALLVKKGLTPVQIESTKAVLQSMIQREKATWELFKLLGV